MARVHACRSRGSVSSPVTRIRRLRGREAQSQVNARATNAYWGRSGLERAILEALAAAGRNVDALTIDDLAPADHFHSGGMNATQRLARLAELRPGMRVLDVGGGLGGPARTLA